MSIERRDMLIRYLLRNMKRQSIELDRQSVLINNLYERLGKVENQLLEPSKWVQSMGTAVIPEWDKP